MSPSDLKDLIANADALLAWAEGRLEWTRPETKVAVRHVRDAAYWKRPVGTIIIAEGLFNKLSNLKQVVTEHPSIAGSLVVTDNKGRKFDVFKHDDKKWYAATHEPDPNKWGRDVIPGQKSQEDAFLALDKKVGGGKTPGEGKPPHEPGTGKTAHVSNADKATKLAAGRRRASAAGERARKAERAKAKAPSTSKKLPPVLQTSLSGTVAGEPYNLETTDGWTFLKKPTVRTVDSRVRGKTTARKHITVTVMNDKGEERTTTVIRHGKGAFSTDKSTQVHGSLNEALRAGLGSSVKPTPRGKDTRPPITDDRDRFVQEGKPTHPSDWPYGEDVRNMTDEQLVAHRREVFAAYQELYKKKRKSSADKTRMRDLDVREKNVVREQQQRAGTYREPINGKLMPRKKAPSKPRAKSPSTPNEGVKINLIAPKGWTFGTLKSTFDPSNPGGYLISGSVHNDDDDLVFLVRRNTDGKYETRGKTFTDINKALTEAMNTVIRANTVTSMPRKKAPSKPRDKAPSTANPSAGGARKKATTKVPGKPKSSRKKAGGSTAYSTRTGPTAFENAKFEQADGTPISSADMAEMSNYWGSLENMASNQSGEGGGNPKGRFMDHINEFLGHLSISDDEKNRMWKVAEPTIMAVYKKHGNVWGYLDPNGKVVVTKPKPVTRSAKRAAARPTVRKPRPRVKPLTRRRSRV